jgi:hypothetical protein
MMRVALIVAAIGMLAAVLSLVGRPAAAPSHKGNKLPVQRTRLYAHAVPTISYKVAGDIILAPELVLPQPKPPPEAELLEQHQPADSGVVAPVQHRVRSHDPCARYGGHKVVTRSGYWHCRHG